MSKIVLLIFLTISGFLGCNEDTNKHINNALLTNNDSLKVVSTEVMAHEFKYQLDQPNETFKLPNELQEISGLGIDQEGIFLYAIQDELGKIYKISKADGEVLEKIKFHKDGDYEGIELVGDDVFVVKSTGTLYQVSNLGTEKQQMKKFNSFLSRENDVEGLAYDKKNNRLLLACKGLPTTGESFEIVRYKKVIYAFDLAENTMSLEPVYTIQLDNIRKFLDAHKGLRAYEKLTEFFSMGKENLTFNPSAIAIHPLTGNIFVTSSSGKVLIVLNEAGDVIHIEKLKKSVHVQPEGLIFDKYGNLYISNEGKGGKAKIYKFNYQK